MNTSFMASYLRVKKANTTLAITPKSTYPIPAILLALLLLSGLNACSEKESAFDQLMAETMEIHDGDMKRMGELMNLKSGLKKAIKVAAPAQLIALKTTLDDLESAEHEMMQWMRNFAREFPDGAMSHEGMDHAMSVETDHDQMDHSGHKGHVPKSDLDRLKDERKTMDSMRITFNTSLDQARNLLQSITQTASNQSPQP